MSTKVMNNIIYRSNLHNTLIGRYNANRYSNILFSTTAKVAKPVLKDTSSTSIHSNHNKSVGIWLLSCSGLVFGIVVVGGLTRLTKSGLSMTDWKFQGGFPPFTQENWEQEFTKYQQYPEFKRVNKDMSLSEFKSIYKWEYSHRMYGRFIGFAFTVPFIYYATRGYISKHLYKRLGVLFALGFSQGLIGWWMVKSGLEEAGNNTYNNLPRVSPYRLATHLGFAFILYIGLLYNGMYVYSQRQSIKLFLSELKINKSEGVNKMYRMCVHNMSLFALLTAMMGAFVAGNEAGLVYNDWPKMGLGYIPNDLWNPYIESKWRNLFENSTMVQFLHRNLAYATVIGSILLFGYTKRLDKLGLITKNILYVSGSLMSLSLLQSTLGVLTLINEIPLSLASMHQAGSLTVLGTTVLLLFLTRKNGYGASNKLMNQIMRNGKPSFLII
eukprot:90419_1